MSTPQPIRDDVSIKCLIVRETERAILVKVAQLDGKGEWFPLSTVSYIQNTPLEDSDEEYPDTLHVAKWIATKKGIL